MLKYIVTPKLKIKYHLQWWSNLKNKSAKARHLFSIYHSEHVKSLFIGAMVFLVQVTWNLADIHLLGKVKSFILVWELIQRGLKRRIIIGIARGSKVASKCPWRWTFEWKKSTTLNLIYSNLFTLNHVHSETRPPCRLRFWQKLRHDFWLPIKARPWMFLVHDFLVTIKARLLIKNKNHLQQNF